MVDVLYDITGGRQKRLRDMADGSYADVVAMVGVTTSQDFLASVTTLTRPANQTPYTAKDSISNHATAGSVIALPCTMPVTTADLKIFEFLADTTDTALGDGITLRVHVFTSDPTASSGVSGGDNALWANKKAGWIGSLSAAMVTFSDGSRGRLLPDGGTYIPVVAGTVTVWVQYQAITGFTPSANSTVLNGSIKGRIN